MMVEITEETSVPELLCEVVFPELGSGWSLHEVCGWGFFFTAELVQTAWS